MYSSTPPGSIKFDLLSAWRFICTKLNHRMSAGVQGYRIWLAVVRLRRRSLHPVNSGWSFTENSGSFAEYRVSVSRFFLRISPIAETQM